MAQSEKSWAEQACEILDRIASLEGDDYLEYLKALDKELEADSESEDWLKNGW